MRPRTLLIAAVTTTALLAPALPGLSTPAQAAPAARIGAFTSSDLSGLHLHQSMESWAGGAMPYALDYASATLGWTGLEDPHWVFDAWRGSGYRLVYSLQMFPHSVSDAVGVRGALRQCASGAFDGHWHTLAANLVANQLASTVVRPGWEMNGNWFGWSAGGHTADYISCFRHVVSTMRAVSGQHFAFDWNPSIGAGQFPAEQAYPGDDVVDVVGPDLYDTSWAPHTYHDVAGQTAAQRQAAVESAWQAKYSGDHGLQWWSAFASAHGKSLSMPEWGLALRHDGYGGGDDPYFIQKMFDFIYDPGNHVLFATYFNNVSPDGEHRVYGSSAFPRASALFRALVADPPGSSTTTGSSTGAGALVRSSGPSRTSPTPLSGATVSSSLYAFLQAPAGTVRVDFRIDDPSGSRPPAHSEGSAPWDLAGTSGSSALPYDAGRLPAGTHTVTATVTLTDGSRHTTSATFTRG